MITKDVFLWFIAYESYLRRMLLFIIVWSIIYCISEIEMNDVNYITT
jgi:hypothetical protein